MSNVLYLGIHASCLIFQEDVKLRYPQPSKSVVGGEVEGAEENSHCYRSRHSSSVLEKHKIPQYLSRINHRFQRLTFRTSPLPSILGLVSILNRDKAKHGVNSEVKVFIFCQSELF